MNFLSKDVLPTEDRWLSGLSESSLTADASRQASSAAFMVFRLQEQVVRHKEKVLAAVIDLREAQKDLEEAKKCVINFELMMTKKEMEIKQKENDLKLKDIELKLSGAEVRKRDQLLAASIARLKEHVRESEGLRAELEDAKKSFQLKDEEISRLFDEAESQFDAGLILPSGSSSPNFWILTTACLISLQIRFWLLSLPPLTLNRLRALQFLLQN